MCEEPEESDEGSLLFALGEELCVLQGRAEGQIQQDDADGGGHAVDEGDASGDLAQGLGKGVFLTENVHVAEIAEERVSDDIEQQASSQEKKLEMILLTLSTVTLLQHDSLS